MSTGLTKFGGLAHSEHLAEAAGWTARARGHSLTSINHLDDARHSACMSDDRPAHRFRKLPVREDRRKPQISTVPEVGRWLESHHAIRC